MDNTVRRNDTLRAANHTHHMAEDCIYVSPRTSLDDTSSVVAPHFSDSSMTHVIQRQQGKLLKGS